MPGMRVHPMLPMLHPHLIFIMFLLLAFTPFSRVWPLADEGRAYLDIAAHACVSAPSSWHSVVVSRLVSATNA